MSISRWFCGGVALFLVACSGSDNDAYSGSDFQGSPQYTNLDITPDSDDTVMGGDFTYVNYHDIETVTANLHLSGEYVIDTNNAHAISMSVSEATSPDDSFTEPTLSAFETATSFGLLLDNYFVVVGFSENGLTSFVPGGSCPVTSEYNWVVITEDARNTDLGTSDDSLHYYGALDWTETGVSEATNTSGGGTLTASRASNLEDLDLVGTGNWFSVNGNCENGLIYNSGDDDTYFLSTSSAVLSLDDSQRTILALERSEIGGVADLSAGYYGMAYFASGDSVAGVSFPGGDFASTPLFEVTVSIADDGTGVLQQTSSGIEFGRIELNRANIPTGFVTGVYREGTDASAGATGNLACAADLEAGEGGSLLLVCTGQSPYSTVTGQVADHNSLMNLVLISQ